MTCRRAALFLLCIVVAGCSGQFFLPDHPYAPPQDSDQRSPCPGLNVLANHGYIFRNGSQIPADMVVKSGSYVFGAEEAFFIALLAQRDFLNLDELYIHNVVEHDASLVRSDEYFDGPRAQFNQSLFDQLVERSDDGIFLTAEQVSAHQRDRVLHSRMYNPEHSFNHTDRVPFFLGAEKLGLYVLGGAGVDGDGIRIDSLESFLRDGRIPDDFVPRTDQGLDIIRVSEGSSGALALEQSIKAAASYIYEPLPVSESEVNSTAPPSATPPSAESEDGVGASTQSGGAVLCPFFHMGILFMAAAFFVTDN